PDGKPAPAPRKQQPADNFPLRSDQAQRQRTNHRQPGLAPAPPVSQSRRKIRMNLAVALEISVLFVCIWGFIAILLTGQFGFTMVLLCTAAVIAGYYVRRKGWRPSALIGNLSAIIVFLITIFIFATTYNLLSATLHLFLFLQVTKYITRRELSESRWCYVISLFNVIGASVITTAVVFGPVLIIRLFLMLVSLRLYVTA